MAMPETETVQLIKKILPVHGICVNKFVVPNFMECYGTCNSGAKYNKQTGSFEKKCECCSIKELTNISVDLTCLDGYKTKLEVAVPKVCGCSPCSEEIMGQNLIPTKNVPQQQFTKTKNTKY